MENGQSSRRLLRQNTKSAASKYDFVKVKVWLGENLNHYYILSRFLISRTLTVTKIPAMKAVKIATEVKKYLVDKNFLDVAQKDLEATLFNIMQSKGYGEEYIRRYKMMTDFHHKRRPLVILICGAPCTGKSTLAQQLASRLNLPNVLQTDIIYELLRTSEDAPLNATPLWEREDLSEEQMIAEFQRECRVVRKGVEGDLVKSIRDGKSIIIEGLHLDPGLYLYEFGRYGLSHLDHTLRSETQQAKFEAQVEHDEEDAEAVLQLLRESNRRPVRRSSSHNDVTFMLQKGGLAQAACAAEGGGQRFAARTASGSRMMLLGNSMNGRMSPKLVTYYEAEEASWPMPSQPYPRAAAVNLPVATTSPVSSVAFSPATEWLHHLERYRQPSDGAATPRSPSKEELGPAPAQEDGSGSSGGGGRREGLLVGSASLDDLLSRWSSNGSSSAELFGIVGAAEELPGTSGASEDTAAGPSGQPKGTSASVANGRTHLQRSPSKQHASSHGAHLLAHAASGATDDDGPDTPKLAGSQQQQQHEAKAPPHRPAMEHSTSGSSESNLQSLVSLIDWSEDKEPAGAPPPAHSAALNRVLGPAIVKHGAAVPFGFDQHTAFRLDVAPNVAASLASGKADELQSGVVDTLPPPPPIRTRLSLTKPPRPVHVAAAAEAEHGAVTPTAEAVPAGRTSSVTEPAAPQQQDGEGEAASGPVFVPIVLSMDPQDHGMLVEEWVQRQQGQSTASPSALRRVRALQEYLANYHLRSVPVFHLDVDSFPDILDKLHSYLLQCIEIAVQKK